MNLSDFASKCSWVACGFCAILAILAVPESARGDQSSECAGLCAGSDIMNGDWQQCLDDCNAAYPQCGQGTPECQPDVNKSKDQCEPGKDLKCKDSTPGCLCRFKFVGSIEKCICYIVVP